MQLWKRRLLLTTGAILAIVLIVLVVASTRALRVGAGYGAKIMASGVFVAGRSPEEMLANELRFYDFLQYEVNHEDQSVYVSFHGLAGRRAIFVPGRGAIVVHDLEDSVRSWTPGPAPRDDADEAWPTGETAAASLAPEDVDMDTLRAVVADAFEASDLGIPSGTRAVVVVHHGRLLLEQYAEGFDQNSPLLGWSMTKSVTNALVGILSGQDKLDIYAPAPVPEWQGEDDPRRAITVDHLLRMSSGLAFEENYGNPFGDAVQMLFASTDAGAFAAKAPAAHAPDTVWYYSSGSTNLIQRIIRHTVGEEAYPSFPRRALFDRIGMRSAIMEPDASGTFVGSSFMYATARDWARFGLLFLNDGVWEGERILPAGWVDYARTPTPAASRGRYGAQWWMNAGEDGDPETRPDKGLPSDWYFASGFEGQSVNIFPSQDLVVVRLGFTPNQTDWNYIGFLEEVLGCFSAEPPATVADAAGSKG